MSLWWPRSVSYLNDAKPLPGSQPDTSLSNPSTHAAVPPAQSPIYPTPLKPNEIRLACLLGTPSPDAPVHLSLETYPLSNCPPYETASYCWAGEDGDDARTRPVYVGPHWDVMLHTKNCWELLRFARPARGVRLVWVDAVCIDQGCDEERAAQVAQMGRIYMLCTQVVVYLGPDVAPLLPEGRHPRRARLKDFGRADGDGAASVRGVSELLQRRYFSRLWVVQELILSPRVVVRIGDAYFQSDGTTGGNLWAADLNDLAPWVQHTSRGAPLELEFLQVMRLTFSTACADPRDRLFGVTGILDDGRRLFAPDYSLPVQHVFIGLFAHLIIVKGMKYLLSLGSGASGPASVPSWVPDWTSWNNWQLVFDPSRISESLTKGTIYGSIGCLIRECVPALSEYYDDNLALVLLPQRYRVVKGLHREPAFSVDSTTGTLRAKMVLLMTLNNVLKLVGRLAVDDLLMLFEARAGDGYLYLASRKRLDMVVTPGTDDLHLFERGEEDPSAGFCILRTTAANSNTVRLVTTCEAAVFCFPISGPVEEPKSVNERRPNLSKFVRVHARRFRKLLSSATQHSSLAQLLDGMDDERRIIQDLYSTVGEVIEWAQDWLDEPLDPREKLLFLLPHNAKRRDVLPVYAALIAENLKHPLNAYRQHVPNVLSAEFRHDQLVFTAPVDIFNTHSEQQLDDLPWCRWKTLRHDRTRVIDRIKWSHVSAMVWGADKEQLKMIRAAAEKTGESVHQLLSRQPTEADRLLRVPIGKLGNRLINECGCDGSVQFVNII